MALNPIQKAAGLLSPWRGYEAHRPPPHITLPLRDIFHRDRRPQLIAQIKGGDPERHEQWGLRCEQHWPTKKRWDTATWALLALVIAGAAAVGVLVYMAGPHSSTAPLIFSPPPPPIAAIYLAWRWVYDRKTAKVWAEPLENPSSDTSSPEGT